MRAIRKIGGILRGTAAPVARACACALIAAVVLPVSGSVAASTRALQPPLRFGIYPGGTVGTVAGGMVSPPDSFAHQLQALRMLAGPSRNLVVRLYTSFDGRPLDAQGLGQWVRKWTDAGFDVSFVLRYQANGGLPQNQVQRFASAVSSVARELASNPRVVSLQIGNEGNVYGAPDASDGSYQDSTQAIAEGVHAAAQALAAPGGRRIAVGVNAAAAAMTAADETRFWSELAYLGGPALAGEIDWVGVNVYPGTFYVPGAPKGVSRRDLRRAVRAALRHLRRGADQLGLPATTPMQLTELGYPTGSGRSEQQQAKVLRDLVSAVRSARDRYPVTTINWFDLRDGDSAASSFECHYGLMRDDYTPKPAFGAFRSLVSPSRRR